MRKNVIGTAAVASVLLVLTLQLSACSFINDKLDKLCYLEPVDTGIHATDDVYEGFMFKSLTIQGEVYCLLTDEHANLLHADKDKTEILSPFANFGDDPLYTLYEVRTDAGIKLYTDNRNLALFCKETDVDTFHDFYSDYVNYDFFYYDEEDPDREFSLPLDASDVERLKNFVEQYSIAHDFTQDEENGKEYVDYEPTGDFKEQMIVNISVEKRQTLGVRRMSKDRALEGEGLFSLVLCNGKYYYAIDGDGKYAVLFEDAYQAKLKAAIK